MSATTTVNAPAQTVFDVLADPSTHAAIDGTGWVRESLDGVRLTETGQVFRMAMYHDNHPDKDYEMANKVVVYDPPHAIAWEPGQDSAGDGNLQFGGWIWRYNLEAGRQSETEVTLSYDGRQCRNICARHSVPAVRPRAPGQLGKASGRACQACALSPAIARAPRAPRRRCCASGSPE